MAVQAQHPSNILLLNRDIQESKNQLGNDYSMQSQPGAFINNTHPVNHNICNGRKRGREMNYQQHHLIDLTQLHTPPVPPPNAVVSTGLRLSFGDQLQHNSISSQSSTQISLLTQDFATQIKQQRDEIDQFLRAQGDQLRHTLAQNRPRHYRALLGAAEEAMARRMREKEAEVEKAGRRNAELQSRAAHFSAEAQVWQSRARAQEATAATLQAQLQNAIMSGGCAQKPEGTLTSASGEGGAEDAESVYTDPDRVEVSTGPSCKACQKRVASVVLLPCRHLSVCTECNGVVQSCPVCLSFRSSSVEVFLG